MEYSKAAVQGVTQLAAKVDSITQMLAMLSNNLGIPTEDQKPVVKQHLQRKHGKYNRLKQRELP